MFLLLAGLLFGATTSGLTITESTEYYEVTGSSAEELWVAIHRQAPRDHKGKRGVGMTHWEMQWKYQLKQTSSGCVPTSLNIAVEIITTLPRWKNRYSDTALADTWNRYLAALEAHEREHLEIALRATQEIHERLSRLDAARTCTLLQNSIDSTAEALLNDLDRVQSEYDRRTNHGVSQGVRFH